jgi:hypothetical protein
MPFRGVVANFPAGQVVRLLTAEPGDLEVTVSVKPFGATGTSGAPNFWIGGPELQEAEVGLLVTGNEWTTSLQAGDVLYVKHAEELPFATSWTITALIRSAP